MEVPAQAASSEAEALKRRLRELEAERAALEAALAAATLRPGGAPRSDDVVALSVGGQRFVTTRATLQRVPDTYFSTLLSGRFQARTDDGGALFIDRSAAGFALLLEWLRCGAMPATREARTALLEEADYFGVAPLIEQLEVRARRESGERACCASFSLRLGAVGSRN